MRRASLLALAVLLPAALHAQTPAAAPRVSCPVTQPSNTDADYAMRRREFSAALELFRAQRAAATDEHDIALAEAGIVRALLNSGDTPHALEAAKKSAADHPKSADIQNALGEVYFRRGETNLAATAFNTAVNLDFCNPRTHFDMARYLRLNGMYASEQRQLDVARSLSPRDTNFARAANPGQRLSLADRIDRLSERLNSGELSAEERASIQRTLDVMRAQSKGSCQITHPVESTKLNIVAIADGPYPMRAAGLDVQLNGKRHRLEIDTGASGLMISRGAALSSGIVTEAETRGGGIGDKGPVKEFLAHVDNIRIGNLEFSNCLVRVFDKKSPLEIDGLIGADVFSPWVVTIDIPQREVRLTPLPPRPGDAAQTTELDTAGGGENAQNQPRDRYVAPEMRDWVPVFRYAHNLIFPTMIANAPARLFIMDTGASHTLVSTSAAREVTGISASDRRIRGISGEVDKVSEADNITLTFARVRAPLGRTTAIDTTNLGRGAGVDISGLIGFETLSELVISIDYRDNLVHIVYDPKHGFHR